MSLAGWPIHPLVDLRRWANGWPGRAPSVRPSGMSPWRRCLDYHDSTTAIVDRRGLRGPKESGTTNVRTVGTHRAVSGGRFGHEGGNDAGFAVHGLAVA